MHKNSITKRKWLFLLTIIFTSSLYTKYTHWEMGILTKNEESTEILLFSYRMKLNNELEVNRSE